MSDRPEDVLRRLSGYVPSYEYRGGEEATKAAPRDEFDAALDALVAERDAAARRAEDLEAMTRASVDEANLALAAERVRGDKLEARLLERNNVHRRLMRAESKLREVGFATIHCSHGAKVRRILAADPEGGSPET